MQPFIIVLPLMLIVFIAFPFIKGFKSKNEGKAGPKRLALSVALLVMVLTLSGLNLVGGFELPAHSIGGGIAGILANGLGFIDGALAPGVSTLGAGLAMGAAAPAAKELLTLKELADLDKPFAAEASELFASVRDHDFKTLSARCDDDFGIVDINTEGGSEVIRSRTEWENWFKSLFKQLSTMQAKTDTLIASYDAVDWGETGMSVVEFVQLLHVGGKTGRFNVIVTIVWKKVEGRWVEARWHSSLVSTELPEGFGA
ncbi:MAG: nuclear transport factor 2 family protein [Bacillota bacterium]